MFKLQKDLCQVPHAIRLDNPEATLANLLESTQKHNPDQLLTRFGECCEPYILIIVLVKPQTNPLSSVPLTGLRNSAVERDSFLASTCSTVLAFCLGPNGFGANRTVFNGALGQTAR